MALSIVPAKRKEPENEEAGRELALGSKRTKTDLVVVEERYSSLLAPIMQLTGHRGAIYTSRFNPDGTLLASASFDKTIFIWNVFGDCKNTAVLSGHKNAVLEANWSPSGHHIYSCSADKTVALWDVETASRIRRFLGHTAVVHSVSMTPKPRPSADGDYNLILSVSDDCKVKVWDSRVKQCQRTVNTTHPATAVQFNKTGDGFFTAGVDNSIRFWDLRKLNTNSEEEDDRQSSVYSLTGHQDTITGLSLSPNGDFLLSNAMDLTVRAWDIRPYAEGNRNIRLLEGIAHSAAEKGVLKCSWGGSGSVAGDLGGARFISGGSADRLVTIWKTATGEIVYRLPGHKGTVNDVQFHPNESIIASCSNDKTIFLGEIDPKA